MTFEQFLDFVKLFVPEYLLTPDELKKIYNIPTDKSQENLLVELFYFIANEDLRERIIYQDVKM
jgi:hypothetical protein